MESRPFIIDCFLFPKPAFRSVTIQDTGLSEDVQGNAETPNTLHAAFLEKCQSDPYQHGSQAETGEIAGVVSALLRFLYKFEHIEHEEQLLIAEAAASMLVSAARRLWYLGALQPGDYGHPPHLTALGKWMAASSASTKDDCNRNTFPRSPAVLRALFLGSAWKCLVPVAAVVALLQPLAGGLTPNKDLRKLWQKVSRTSASRLQTCWSGHFVMVAAYLRWKESKAHDASNGQLRCRKGDVVWEALDCKVIAMCRYAFTAFGYCGEDAADVLEHTQDNKYSEQRPRTRTWAVESMLITSWIWRCTIFVSVRAT